VLALPAESRGGGERLLHHGGGIDEHFCLAADRRDERAGDALELSLEDLVIVLALRIGRDRAALGFFEDRQRIAVGAVIEADHDDGAHLSPQRARIAASLGRALHPFHLAVHALREELGEARRRAGDRVRSHDSGDLEPVRARERGDRALALRGVQKSRSA
jgi:hypothetical protein